LEIVDAIRREGATVTADLRELFRRLVFNVLVSNGDDHLRNHGLLRNSRGWSLAPAYDLNPMPPDVRPRVQALAIDERDATSSMETVFAVAAAFGIDAKEAKRIAREVAKAVKGWRAAARTLGLSSRDLARMEAAFEHEDLELAASAR
jgi:serine/threonine-protein kinase HipA